ncbi:MAG: ATP-binding protein [Deltaproteobacteria bacterium]|nr:ATP-binding protein [Deltaproteobacteria bacterium]
MSPLFFYRWSLGAKFSLTLFTVVCIVAFMISLFVIKIGEGAMEDELKERGVAAVNILSRLSVEPVMREQLWDIYELTKIMSNMKTLERNLIVYAMVMDKTGVLLGHSDPGHNRIGSKFDRVPVSNKIDRFGSIEIVEAKDEYGKPLLDVSSPIILDGKRIGTVHVGITKRYVQEALARQRIAVFFIASILAFTCFLAGQLIAKRMTKPLMKLSENMNALREGLPIENNLLVLKEKDEIGMLADTFNLMAVSLKEKEGALIKSERLSSLGEFAAGLAHEIRNPLSAIVTAMNIVGSKNVEAEDLSTLKGVVRKEADRLNKLLSSFLVFARPESPRLSEVNINEILRETLELIVRDNRLRGNIKLEMDLAEDMKKMKLDPDQIRQVFWNILINSCQAMDGSGNLKVSSTSVDGKGVVSITDTGSGMEKEEAARIFEPFFTTKEKGSGLGLAVSKKIVEAHGGKIAVKSKPGIGTRFSLEFPAM